MIILWLICTCASLYVLARRDQINPLTVILALTFWPIALIVAAMVPSESRWDRSQIYRHGQTSVSDKLGNERIFKE